MKVHVFQHVPFEGLGALEPWFQRRHAEVNVTRFFDDARLPATEPDVLVVLGGPMSVNDEERYPWLAVEKQYLRRAIEARVRVLGICLGAQLIASALGARVWPNRTPEIGWFDIEGTGASPMFERARQYPVFQWHGETFALPNGATLLATSEACTHQAYTVGALVLGLQFHLEFTRSTAASLVEHCPGQLLPGPFVQSEAELLGVDDGVFAQLHVLLDQVLAGWLGGEARSETVSL